MSENPTKNYIKFLKDICSKNKFLALSTASILIGIGVYWFSRSKSTRKPSATILNLERINRNSSQNSEQLKEQLKSKISLLSKGSLLEKELLIEIKTLSVVQNSKKYLTHEIETREKRRSLIETDLQKYCDFIESKMETIAHQTEEDLNATLESLGVPHDTFLKSFKDAQKKDDTFMERFDDPMQSVIEESLKSGKSEKIDVEKAKEALRYANRILEEGLPDEIPYKRNLNLKEYYVMDNIFLRFNVEEEDLNDLVEKLAEQDDELQMLASQFSDLMKDEMEIETPAGDSILD